MPEQSVLHKQQNNKTERPRRARRAGPVHGPRRGRRHQILDPLPTWHQHQHSVARKLIWMTTRSSLSSRSRTVVWVTHLRTPALVRWQRLKHKRPVERKCWSAHDIYFFIGVPRGHAHFWHIINNHSWIVINLMNCFTPDSRWPAPIPARVAGRPLPRKRTSCGPSHSLRCAPTAAPRDDLPLLRAASPGAPPRSPLVI